MDLKREHFSSKIETIFTLSFSFIFVGVVLFFVLFLDFISKHVYSTHFYQKTDSTIIIAGRHIDIGATDDGNNIDTIVKIQPVGSYFNWIRPCDTTLINKNEWQKL
jgi:hypothetical protein